MKKNTMMRIASLVLVLTLLSTCAISGTFAKYVTSDSAADSARVAKFGVTLTAANDSSFKTDYERNTTETGATMIYTVSAEAAAEGKDRDKVVAPGTSSGEKGITFTISGTPEVATKISIDMDVKSDIFLAAGTYADWTTSGNAEDTFSVGEGGYYPVVFTLTQIVGADESAKKIDPIVGNLATIEKALEEYANSAYYAPNTKLDATFKLTWAWAFEGTGDDAAKKLVDQADTLLGNLAVGGAFLNSKSSDNGLVAMTEGKNGDYSTKIEYTITFTVTQVD